VTTPSARLNPFFSMWTQPRRSIREALTMPEHFVIALACVWGISRALDRASYKSLGDRLSLPWVLAFAIGLGPITGVTMLYLFGWLLGWTGRWMGGAGSPSEIRAAIAWPHVITFWGLLLWIPELLVFGRELFTTATPRLDASLGLSAAMIGFFLLEATLLIWSIVAYLHCLGEVQRFSAWKAFGNTIVAILVFLMITVPIAIVLVMVWLLVH
jgi:hypothetical protein